MSEDSAPAKVSQFHLDLLRWPLVRSLLRSAAFPLAIQILGLLCVLGLVLNGWGLGIGSRSEELMIWRKTNLTTLFVWGLWWPAMIALAMALGRAWCTVCPMELVSRIGDSLGRRLGRPRFRLVSWMRAGWFIVLAYLVLQFLVAGMEIHRVPHLTSIMLITLGVLAFTTGILFREPRSFCKSFCPAKALLSVYGRFTPWQLDVRDPDLCAGCRTRECVNPRRRFLLDGRSCPSLLSPYRRRASDNCVLCLQCAKACPYGNVGLGVVRPTAHIRKPHALVPYEAAFVMLAAGFVAHEDIGEVMPVDAWFHWLPTQLQVLFPFVGFGWFEAIWFLVVFPLVLWTLAAGLAFLFGHRGTLKSLLIAAATGAAPVVAVAHLAKAAAKVSSWAGFLPGALHEPSGVEAMRSLLAKSVTAPAPLLGLPILGWVMLIGVLFMAWRSRKWVVEANPGRLAAAGAGASVTTVFFLSVLLCWPWSW